MNMNFFKRFDKVVFGTWKMFDKKDYQKYSTLVSKMKDDKKQKIIPTNQSNFEQLKQFQEKYNLSPELHSKLKNVKALKVVARLKKRKKKLLMIFKKIKNKN